MCKFSRNVFVALFLVLLFMTLNIVQASEYNWKGKLDVPFGGWRPMIQSGFKHGIKLGSPDTWSSPSESDNLEPELVTPQEKWSLLHERWMRQKAKKHRTSPFLLSQFNRGPYTTEYGDDLR